MPEGAGRCPTSGLPPSCHEMLCKGDMTTSPFPASFPETASKAMTQSQLSGSAMGMSRAGGQSAAGVMKCC